MSDSPVFLPTAAELKALPDANDALPMGTRLSEFEVRGILGVGGFGIVYRAWDFALEREVAVKEYMPAGMVTRGEHASIVLRSRAHEEDFTLGLRSFVNEARLLALFDHPALVKVYRFWEANGTAYMAMPFYQARTLRQRRRDMGTHVPSQEWLLSMMEPLLGALEEMHRADVYHRDIAPDNILWCTDSRPVLLDFGAARRVLTDRTQSLTAILKPQFAPLEQYADAQSMRQGPWTDVFALASTCYFMLTGRPPLPATARILGDDLMPLAQLALPGFAPHVLAALDWAMALRPEDRPQSVAILRAALLGLRPVPERAATTLPAAPARTPADITGLKFERTIQASTPTPTPTPTSTIALPLPLPLPLPDDGTIDLDLAPTRRPAGGARVTALSTPVSVRVDAPSRHSLRMMLLAAGIATAAACAALLPGPHRHAGTAPSAATARVDVAANAANAAPPTLAAPAASAPVATSSSSSASSATTTAAAVPPRAHAGATAHRPHPGVASTHVVMTSASLDAASRDGETRVAREAQEEVAWAAAHEASAPSAAPRHRADPRQACEAAGAADIAACVQHACDSDPRLRHGASCQRARSAG